MEAQPLDYFIDRLKDNSASLELPDETIVYTGNLLVRMMDLGSLYIMSPKGIIDRPFCLQISDAESMPPPLKSQGFQRIADSILFYTGVFRKKIFDDGIDLNYYVTLGRISYRKASELNRASASSTLGKMSEAFPALSTLIAKAIPL